MPYSEGEVGCVQGPVQIQSSNGNTYGSTLTVIGGGGLDGATQLVPTYQWSGPKSGTGNSIVADVSGTYTVTATVSCTSGGDLTTSATWDIDLPVPDAINFTPVINDDGTTVLTSQIMF